MKWRAPATKQPLNGAATVEKIHRARLQSGRVASELGWPSELVLSLVNRHGEESQLILQYMKTMKGTPEERRWLAEGKFSIENEMCLNLVDFYWRRSPLFLFHKDNGLSLLQPLAMVFKEALGWSNSEMNIQMEKVKTQAEKEKSSLRP
jgi:glycerol-3-phosphate dehydrogenase